MVNKDAYSLGWTEETGERFSGLGSQAGTMRRMGKKKEIACASVECEHMALRAGLMEEERPRQSMANDILGLLTGKQTKWQRGLVSAQLSCL